ncbi:sensor histidine kinase [Phenylobacterium hankyongense]|nr:HAMP domain-containing sensor histidine kinase [Phenylobacterium hankyongense]
MRLPGLGSLRGRMLLAFIGLLIVLEVAVALSAHAILHQNYDSGGNRILLGSLKTISVAYAAPEPLRSKVVPMALKLLRRRARPITYYSVYSGGRFVEGLPEIRPPSGNEPHIDVRSIFGARLPHMSEYVDAEDGVDVLVPAYIRPGTFRGVPARIGTEVRRAPGFAEPVVVQIAIEESVLMQGEKESIGYIVIVFGLTLLTGVLAYWQATKWAIRPFVDLQAQLESRAASADFRFNPLTAAPQEAATFIFAFNALLGELKESAVAVSRFTSEASHQMRTPLAVLRTHLDLVRRYGVASNFGQEGLHDMDGAIGTLERLLLQLISLARAEEMSGPAEFREPFDLVSAASAAAADRFEQARGHKVELSFEGTYDNAPLMAVGQPFLARELVGNLIDNAIRYNTAGGSVVVRVERQGGACRLAVIDDGPGIPAESRELVFDRFYRLPRDTERNGSGLGLPIVRALAERMSATLVLEDGPNGRGLAVVVDFAAAEPGSAEASRLKDVAA